MKNTITLIVLLTITMANKGIGQDTKNDSISQRTFVFLDCNARNCDFDHFRREIPWVNWVRDRKDGDIHLLITQLRTGGGGIQYTLDYIGLESLEGKKKTLLYTTDPDDTGTEVRNKLTNMIALGLLQFVDPAPSIASNLHISYKVPEAEPVLAEEYDPWKESRFKALITWKEVSALTGWPRITK